ncbi:60S ribosomal protein L37a [Lactuca sativa]|uniref:60S ribosomal protein L37a n=1 Tax=Lactuca sativa TaxID=4236 RepID=UPI000CD9F55F|nr:60S ribosomal protein L37a [Lactuca sativa]XP_023766529.1 60S ribosomal protein L37a [Lactuca sativa]XP_023766530.1 60S ribosomal protein L37a [Lactuca sativa]XP_042754275.1 60S ribosomal protein L37a [Lactuca sativa]XP_052623505.1 60S ribosomal protein L37a [Lactuca sativa]
MKNLGFQFVIIVVMKGVLTKNKDCKEDWYCRKVCEEKGSWNLGLQELWESQSRGPYTLNTASVVTVRITIRRLREETES